MNSFYGYNKYSNTPQKEFADFWEIIERSLEITEHLALCPDDVDGIGWKVSVPKLIDNAIIGLCNCIEEQGHDPHGTIE